MELNKVFESTPKSIYEVISEGGTCFHLPEYQRPYSWNTDKVERLIEDIQAGCSVLMEHEDAITFLGTLLTVDDYKGESLSAELHSERPTKTRLVIDGQQRLTTLILLITRLYLKTEFFLERIVEFSEKYKSHPVFSEQTNNFADTLHKLAAELRFFSKDTNARDKYSRFYPLLTRSDDIWSKQANKSNYRSSIANYINAINKMSVDNIFNDLPLVEDKIISDNLKTIDKKIESILAGHIFDDEDTIDLTEVNFKFYNQETSLVVDKMPELLNSDYVDKKDKIILSKAIYLSIFSSYLLSRTCFTFVSVSNLDYAFDMFEALNTTGEPLTAYETFRPKTIQYFNEIKDKSPSDELKGRAYLSKVDRYLNEISDATKKNEATKKLVDTFSYAFNGKICGSHISQQRRFLIDTFTDQKTNKLSYLEQLSNTAEFLFSIWYQEENSIMSECMDNKDAAHHFKLSISVLKSTGHEVARPLLSIGYNNFKVNQSEHSKAKFTELAKMLAAFLILRRAGTGGTDGIDACYKELYSGSALKDKKVTFGYDLNHELASIADYLKQNLSEKFSGKNTCYDDLKTKSDWLEKSVKIKQYKTGKQLGICRLLLLSAMHNAVEDQDSPWLIAKGKENSQSTLNYWCWEEFNEQDSKKYTIEHIAPQNPKEHTWDESLKDGELTDTLGNLVILAQGDNSTASNSSWDDKRKFYKELAKKSDINNNRNYNQFIGMVAKSQNWTAKIVKQRGESLLDNSWDNLIKWIIS